MKDYVKYQHVEKLGSSEVNEILLGKVYVFPKLDGTNAHVWADDEGMHYGSRKRELSLEKDNAGFMAWASQQTNLINFCLDHKGYHVFGEWLVPHSLKTYKEDAWRKLYIFDVTYADKYGHIRHLPYQEYSEELSKYGLEFIVPQRILINPHVSDCTREMDNNEWLVTEGKGEGVVLKNYDFVNKYGRQTWAKLVTSDFKQKHHKEMGAPVTKCTKLVEQEVVDKLLSEDIIKKAKANICVQEDGWNSKLIPRLLETVWHDFITECSYEMVKRWKLPKIDYKALRAFATQKIKQELPEVF